MNHVQIDIGIGRWLNNPKYYQNSPELFDQNLEEVLMIMFDDLGYIECSYSKRFTTEVYVIDCMQFPVYSFDINIDYLLDKILYN